MRVLLALALIVVGLPLTSPSAHAADGPISSAEAGSQECAGLLFVGARESGGATPFGVVIPAIRDQVVARWHGTVRQVYLDYPAVDPHELSGDDLTRYLLDPAPPPARYQRSVDSGVTALRAVLDDSRSRCPDEDVVLVGLSQGAEVITQALATGVDIPRLRGALLLGNPAHYPGQNAQELDGQVGTPAIGLEAMLAYLRWVSAPAPGRTREQSLHDLLAVAFRLYEGSVAGSEFSAALRASHATIPASAYAHVFSVCSVGDMVCDAAGPMSRVLSGSSTMDQEFVIARPVHLGYTPQVVKDSLEAIVGDGRPRASVASIPASTPAATPSAGQESGSVLPWLLGLGGACLVMVALSYTLGHRRGRRRL